MTRRKEPDVKKLDLRKDLKHLYRPTARKVSVIDVPPMNFAMIDGEIEPGRTPGDSPAFEQAVEALYGISYTLKFASKQRDENPIDYPVMPLEGLWWVEGEDFDPESFDITQPEGWHWRAMIMQPEHIAEEMFAAAVRALREKKDPPGLDKLRFETFHEGLSIQIMHIGPYAEEMATIEKMDAFADANGYTLHGHHHEIYLGDPRRAKPENLKTVLRHPVREENE